MGLWLFIALVLSWYVHRRLHYACDPTVKAVRANRPLVDILHRLEPIGGTGNERREWRSMCLLTVAEAYPQLIGGRWVVPRLLRDHKQELRKGVARDIIREASE